MKDYGNAIKLLRKKNLMTQTTLAEKLNISGQAVSKWENNLAQPDFDTILKLTEIFNITLDEFTRLCTCGEADATPADAETAATVAATPAPEPVYAPAPVLIGVCSCCGRSLYQQKDVAITSPKLVCAKCKEDIERKKKLEAEKLAIQKAQKHAEQASIFRKTMIWPAVIAGIIALALTIIAPSDFWVWFLLGMFGYIIAVQIKFDNGLVAEIFDWSFGKTFAKPGLIIPLSLDGFLWALGVKIVMAIIWFFLSLFVTLLGLALCVAVSPICFPVSIVRAVADMRDGVLNEA